MASNMTFVMFGILIVGVLAGQWVLNSESFAAVNTPAGSGQGLSAVSGNVTENLTPSYSANLIIAILFMAVSAYLIYRVQDRRYKLKLESDITGLSKYSAFIMRLVLGIVFVWQAFNVTLYLNNIFIGIVYVVTGMLLILGLFTRISAYIAIFLLLYQLLQGINPLMFVVLIANTLLVILLGSGVPSYDEELRTHKA